MPKKPEMSQLYNSNEFIFGEKGGKGKNLSTFLKNLSLTNSKEYKETSSIYGSLINPNNESKSSKASLELRDRSSSPSKNRSVSGNSFFTSLTPTTSTHNLSPTRGKRITSSKYADLDDDWDADFETNKAKSDVSKKEINLNGFGGNYQQPIFVDSLYPDFSVINNSKPLVDLEDVKATKEITKLNQMYAKLLKFQTVLNQESNVNIQELRKLSWNGIPVQLRPLVWQLLLGYLPTNKSRQQSTLRIKRQEYINGIQLIEQTVNFDDIKNVKDNQLYHQINIDVKRTNPGMRVYSTSQVQKSLKKVLYFWAIRHPASGYVQGINDLVIPFYQLFLTHYLWQLQRLNDKDNDDYSGFIPGLDLPTKLKEDPNLTTYNLDNLDPSLIDDQIHLLIEADTYWCLSRLLENITDNYIHEQPGIIRQVNDLKNLIAKIDSDLITHFETEGIEFLQFSFRWMNCLLMREIPLLLIIRMWDTYLLEQPLGFNHFHVYVCAAFLIKFSSDLKAKEFQEILLFLQNPPTDNWEEKDVELMLSEAFIWQSLYRNLAHLK